MISSKLKAEQKEEKKNLKPTSLACLFAENSVIEYSTNSYTWMSFGCLLDGVLGYLFQRYLHEGEISTSIYIF